MKIPTTTQRRIAVLVNHLKQKQTTFAHQQQQLGNYYSFIGINKVVNSSSSLLAPPLRNYHHNFASQQQGIPSSENNIQFNKTSSASSSNFKQYWESIYSYIQNGNVSLEESIIKNNNNNKDGGVINISNINKVEIPEDVSQKLALLYMKNLDRSGKIRFFEVMIMHFGGLPIAPLLQLMNSGSSNSSNLTAAESNTNNTINTLSQALDKMKLALQNVQSLSGATGTGTGTTGTGTADNVVDARSILGYLNSIQQLRTSLEPYYEKFLEQFILTLMKKEISIGQHSNNSNQSTTMNGLEFVMQMRKDLLDIISTLQSTTATTATTASNSTTGTGTGSSGDYKKFILPILLSDLNTNLVRLLSSWFSPPFLECKELDWRETNAQLVEKIIHYERVHPIANMESLKKRLAPTPNRKMYGLFHSAMPRVPLVVLQVALMDSISSNMRQVHNVDEKQSTTTTVVNTAIFYSISSTQSGLTGIELGNYLIKKVVGILQQKQLVTDNYNGNIVQFSTLSPIPGFLKWLSQKLRIECNSEMKKFHDESGLLRAGDVELLKKLATEEPQLFGNNSNSTSKSSSDDGDSDDDTQRAKELLLSLVEGIINGGGTTIVEQHPNEKLKPLMERLCARYLYREKHKGKALDPVGNFHMRNGACLERINWQGDLSVRRLKESYGMMVNYKYVLDLVDQNHHDYVMSGAKQIRLGELFDRSLLE